MKTCVCLLLLSSLSLAGIAGPHLPQCDTPARAERQKAHVRHRTERAERREVRHDARYTTRARLRNLRESATN